MRFSLELPTTQVAAADQFVTVEAVTEVTRAAAAAGFDAVNVTDHPAPDARWLDAGGHHAMDPFTVLGVAAAADPGIRLHTHVYVAGYRNPFLGAKAVHTLDVLSGGRLILGVAAGYLKPEFAALGADFAGRGARLDDALAVLDAVYTGADVAHEGAGYSARGVRLRPVRPARPPVWVGGNSAPARRRAARHEGWAPFHTAGYAAATRTEPIEALDDLARAIAEVRAAAAGHGDPDRPFDVCWSEALLSADDVPADRRLAHLAALDAIGVTWVGVTLTAPTRAELLDRVAAYGRDVISEAR